MVLCVSGFALLIIVMFPVCALGFLVAAFSCHYAVPPRHAGTLSLHVELAGGGPISGSPFDVDVRPAGIVPAHATASGRGLFHCEGRGALRRCVLQGVRVEITLFPPIPFKLKNNFYESFGTHTSTWVHWP